MRRLRILLLPVLGLALGAQTPKRVLFDHTRHEEAGTSAYWIICSASEPDPTPANPTVETDWNGGISAWAFDLYQAGYKVQSLPPTGRVTYGDATNPQDLSNYAVYIIDEPYVKFTAAEKQAILSYVQHGGGLFIVGNHQGAKRYSGTGGTDAFTVFDDMVQVNGTDPYGFTFVTGHGPGDAQANTTSSAFTTSTSPAAQAIVNGAYGGLSLMDFHSYSYLNYDTAENPSVQEILHTQVSGDTGSFIVTCTVGSGRVVAISDSAPADDGTTTTAGKHLYASWTANSNRAFFMNATAYLAGATSTAPVPVVSILSPASNATLTAGGALSFQGSATISDGSAMSYSWSFGDGASAAVQGPVSHTYTAAGTYTATFTATSNQGQTASATRIITVNPATPNTVSASISSPASDVTVASGTAVSFAGSATDSSSAASLSYAWTFGDGGTATGASASHTFTHTGSTNATYTVTFTATDSTGASGSTTRTVTVTPAPSGGNTTTQVLGNPGFETGTASPWVATSGVVDNSSSEPAHSGSWKAWLDGYGSSHTDTLYQQVALDPATTAASLSFWLHIDTDETTATAANDTLKLQVRNSSGTLLATLATYSNLDATSGYVQKTFDLSAYKGQTIQLYLVGTENASLQTSFVLDDFALNVTTAGSGGGSDTVPPTVSASENGTSGTITLSATATDNVGVTKVEFYVDGLLKGTDTASPYAMTLDSTALANGNHSLVAKAYDAAGNVGTSSTVTFAVSNSSTTPTDLITNGGFESGTTGWTASSGVIAQNGSNEPAHTGTWDAWLDGYGSSHTDTLAQTVSIPASATTATLAFWLHVDTVETSTTTAYDTLTVQVRNSSGAVLGTLGTFSNLDAGTGYVQRTFDLSAYKGQTVQVFFTGTEDASQQTSFVLDDMSLDVQ